MSQTILECPKIFMIPVNYFPDHLVNVLDYSSCNGHLLRDIDGSCEQCHRPSSNVLGGHSVQISNSDIDNIVTLYRLRRASGRPADVTWYMCYTGWPNDS